MLVVGWHAIIFFMSGIRISRVMPCNMSFIFDGLNMKKIMKYEKIWKYHWKFIVDRFYCTLFILQFEIYHFKHIDDSKLWRNWKCYIIFRILIISTKLQYPAIQCLAAGKLYMFKNLHCILQNFTIIKEIKIQNNKIYSSHFKNTNKIIKKYKSPHQTHYISIVKFLAHTKLKLFLIHLSQLL